MEDPFSALLKSLKSVFHLAAMRNGKYIYPPVEQLKNATKNYNPNAKNSFISLLKAIREALPYIEKWRLNFDAIRKPMDALAKIHQMPSIDWNGVLSHPKVSPRFQFSALNHSRKEDDLTVWLTVKTGKPFDKLNQNEMMQTIVDNIHHHGFSKKLSEHLKKNPDFLFKLIINSEKNFVKISKTRLILYLTDVQIARAIVQHSSPLVHQQKLSFEQVEQYVHKLNEMLSNGRSVSTLLRNAAAKPILEKSLIFQIYQSEAYQNREEQPAPSSPSI